MGMIKDLSSGGHIIVEKKTYTPYAITNGAKFIFTNNNPPVFEDTSDAVKRRFIVVPFDLKLEEDSCGVEKDGKLLAKMIEELPGIFNLALGALDTLLARGGALNPAESKAIVDQYMMDSDSVLRWMHERVIAQPEAKIVIRDAYGDYVEFMQPERNIVSTSTFGRRLRSKFGNALSDGSERSPDGNVNKIYKGIRLRSAAEPF